jgi:hypothetical protein
MKREPIFLFGEDGRDKVIAFLRRTRKELACKHCDSIEYDLYGPVLMKLTAEDGETENGIPVGLLSCVRCGDMQTINLAMAGLFPLKPETPHLRLVPQPPTD